MPYLPNKQELLYRKKSKPKNKDTKRANSCRRGYDRRWRAASKAFLALNPYCQCDRCKGRLGKVANVVHHIIPHKGNKRLFWDVNNWLPMNKACHDRHTRTVERRQVGVSRSCKG